MTREEIAKTLATVNAAQHPGFLAFCDKIQNAEPGTPARTTSLFGVRVAWEFYAAGWEHQERA